MINSNLTFTLIVSSLQDSWMRKPSETHNRVYYPPKRQFLTIPYFSADISIRPAYLAFIISFLSHPYSLVSYQFPVLPYLYSTLIPAVGVFEKKALSLRSSTSNVHPYEFTLLIFHSPPSTITYPNSRRSEATEWLSRKENRGDPSRSTRASIWP